MRIKCELIFPNSLIFCGFLPEKDNSPLEFSHDEGKYNTFDRNALDDFF